MPAIATVTGRLADDPEFTFAGTTQLAILTIPTDEGYGDRKYTTWWRVKVWGKQAERIENAFRTHSMYHKGDNVSASGRASVPTWDKQDGTKGFRAEVNAFEVEQIFPPKDTQRPGEPSEFDQVPF